MPPTKDAMPPRKVRLDTLARMKNEGVRIAACAAYDFPTSQFLDQAGIDVILVGDSLGNVVLGLPNTIPVTMRDMIHHAAAVSRGVSRALVVADMPFMSYQAGVNRALRNAGRLLKQTGVESVKVEGAGQALIAIERMVEAGIPVLGHLGYTPQSAHRFGSRIVQAKTAANARRLLDDAVALESAGAFAVVIECVPAEVARLITRRLSIPTIGIGAGPFCDGQILVFHDLAGITQQAPRFVKRYASLGRHITEAVRDYVRDVRDGSFPGAEHSYEIAEQELRELEAEPFASTHAHR